MLPLKVEGWGLAEKRQIIFFFFNFSPQISNDNNTSKFSRELAARAYKSKSCMYIKMIIVT